MGKKWQNKECLYKKEELRRVLRKIKKDKGNLEEYRI